MNKKVSRIIALVVVLCMIFTTVAFAAPGKKDFERDAKKTELNDEDYNKALLSLIEKEIVKGYGKGEYGLSGNVKRGDVIVMIVRALEFEGLDAKDLGERYLELDDFEDNKDKEAYYYGPVKVARMLEIAKGDGRYFKPNKPVTIQEVIWLLERAEKILDDDLFDNDEEDRMDKLEEMYANDLNQFAKRRDVIFMLNHIIEGLDEPEDEEENEEAELADIELSINEDQIMKLNNKWFVNVLNEAKVENLEYINFVKTDDGDLYYQYDSEEDDNVPVDKKTKYYLKTSGENRVNQITLVPDEDFYGTIKVEYEAYVKNDNNPYVGFIIVTVKPAYEIPRLTFNNLDIDDKYIVINFVDEFADLEGALDEDLFDEDLKKVTFELPDKEMGTLNIRLNDGDFNLVEKGESYLLDDETSIKFEFKKAGQVEFNYRVFDDEDTPYDGKIVLRIVK